MFAPQPNDPDRLRDHASEKFVSTSVDDVLGCGFCEVSEETYQ